MVGEEKKDEVFGEDFNLLDGIDLEGLIPAEEIHTNNNEDETLENNVEENQNNGSGEEDNNENNEQDGEDTNSDDGSNSSPSPLIPYAKYLVEEGILTSLDLEKYDGSIEGLREGMFNEILNGVESYKASLPPVIHDLINNYQEGVPLETLLNINNNVVKYSSITDEQMDSEEMQESIIRDYLKSTTRFSDDKIAKEINKMKDLQELADEAKNALPELIALQKQEEETAVNAAKEQNKLLEQQREAELVSLKKTITESNEIIPGIKVPENIKQKIYKNLTTATEYSDNGMPLNRLGAYRMKNPVQTEILLNYIFEVTNEFKDWNIFSKGAKKSVISEIENAARNLDNNSRNGRSNPDMRFTESSKNFLREIDNYI